MYDNMQMLNELGINKKAIVSGIHLSIAAVRDLNIAGIRENIIISISHWYNKNIAIISTNNGKVALSDHVMKSIVVRNLF